MAWMIGNSWFFSADVNATGVGGVGVEASGTIDV